MCDYNKDGICTAPDLQRCDTRDDNTCCLACDMRDDCEGPCLIAIEEVSGDGS